jgi:hypothetical protein
MARRNRRGRWLVVMATAMQGAPGGRGLRGGGGGGAPGSGGSGAAAWGSTSGGGIAIASPSETVVLKTKARRAGPLSRDASTPLAAGLSQAAPANKAHARVRAYIAAGGLSFPWRSAGGRRMGAVLMGELCVCMIAISLEIGF